MLTIPYMVVLPLSRRMQVLHVQTKKQATGLIARMLTKTALASPFLRSFVSAGQHSDGGGVDVLLGDLSPEQLPLHAGCEDALSSVMAEEENHTLVVGRLDLDDGFAVAAREYDPGDQLLDELLPPVLGDEERATPTKCSLQPPALDAVLLCLQGAKATLVTIWTRATLENIPFSHHLFFVSFTHGVLPLLEVSGNQRLHVASLIPD